MKKPKSYLFKIFFLALMALAASDAYALCSTAAKALVTKKGQELAAILGEPTSNYVWLSETDGCLQHFANGDVYHINGKAFEVHGEIRGRFNLLGAQKGVLGYPQTDETSTADTWGRFNHFQNGSIFWRPCIGAYEVHGLIRNRWAELQWERGPMGYPMSDELTTSDGIGRYSLFQGGAIYYNPNIGTAEIRGEIYRVWKDKGGISGRGSLGYPKGSPTCTTIGGNCSQVFERGTLSSLSGEMVQGRDFRPEIARRGITIRDQGPRRTCSVMTMAFLLDYQYAAMCRDPMALLSEEYLNHVTNKATGRTDDGDFFNFIAIGYEKYGMIPESYLPYDKNRIYDYAKMDALVTNDLLIRGESLFASGLKLKGHFIKPNTGTPGMTQAEFDAVMTYLRLGVPVGIGRGHSMPIVGYKNDAAYDGGGYFIIRDSYGTGTGASGYQTESYKKVREEAYDVYVYERTNN